MRSAHGAARSTVLALARHLDGGTLVIDDEAGTRLVCGTGAPTVEVHVRDERAWSALAVRGSIGLGESYAKGWWDCDDLTSLLRIVLAALRPATRALDRMGTTTARASPIRCDGSERPEERATEGMSGFTTTSPTTSSR